MHDTYVCWHLARQNEHKITFSDQLLNKLVSYTKNQSLLPYQKQCFYHPDISQIYLTEQITSFLTIKKSCIFC